MTRPSLPVLESAVEERYAGLAESCCSLSCGQALELAAPVAGEVFIDLGCGRGQDVIRAAGRVGLLGKAIGIDRTPAMIDKAKTTVPPFLTNVRFICCDLAALGIEDTSANVVISNCTINHAADKEALITTLPASAGPVPRTTRIITTNAMTAALVIIRNFSIFCSYHRNWRTP